MSVTLVHPAKAVGRNEMPFGLACGSNTAPSNIIHGAPVFHGNRRFVVSQSAATNSKRLIV